MLNTYPHVGGIHPESAAFTNILAAQGHSLSEALIFGIAGGIGAGYILWEFQEHQTRILVLGLQHLWNYPVRYYQALADRLQVRVAMPEWSGRKAAVQHLQQVIDTGRPAIAWVDRAYLPYLQLPEAMRGHIGHIVSVCGADQECVWLDDRARAPFPVDLETFNDARARISSYKQRLLTIESIGALDLAKAIQAGLTATVDYLSSASESFSLPALRKWAKLMTDRKNKKGWPTVFADHQGLYNTLRSMFEELALNSGTGGLRGLYADFLDESAGLIDREGLRTVATLYRDLARRWDHLAEIALSDEIAPLAEAKQLLKQRHALLMQGGDAWEQSRTLTTDLRAIGSAYRHQFPADQTAINRLFESISAELIGIYQDEVAALAALRPHVDFS
ncbi:MAG: BtrH N-terminal domain-containing protein [Anaerolineae bacterium]|nr:BtrH N-terminal domain-containing protein [Anaerolineae bacterium]